MGLGYIEFTVAGVKFSAMRLADESHDRYQLSGRAIECDNGLTAEEKVEVGSCEYCCEDYEFDESGVSDEDIIAAIDSYPEYLVEGVNRERSWASTKRRISRRGALSWIPTKRLGAWWPKIGMTSTSKSGRRASRTSRTNRT